MNLRKMRTGQSGVISSIKIGGNLGLRLREMGLVPGTRITVTGRAPLRDPVKLRVKGQTLTLRNNEAADKSSGAGDAEYFALFIPLEWSTGRWGIGPQVNFPADDAKFGSDVWRYGFATAWLERLAGEKILTGLLVQQTWGKTDPEDTERTVAQPITIQPVFNYSLKNGYYVNIGETAFSYNWDASAWLIPLGFRFGKVFINKNGSTYNVYAEVRKSVIYDDWPGSVIDNAVRFNVSYAFPM